MVLVTNGAIASHDNGVDPYRLPIPDTTILPMDRDITITWRARSVDENVKFRLYRGINGGSLELVNETQSVPGTTSYRVKDEMEFSGPVYYELRVVFNQGAEKPLAIARCLVPTLEPDSGSTPQSTHDQIALSILPVVTTPPAKRLVRIDVGVAAGFIPEPQRPPPRD
jgi:hypothetical protein